MRSILKAFVVLVVAGCTTTSSRAGVVNAPTVQSPQSSGDVVAFRLQNASGVSQSAGYVSFGQVFKPGALPSDALLGLKLGGAQLPAQADVKTRHANGSARFAVVTVRAPALSAGAAATGMLTATGTTGPDVSLPVILAGQQIRVQFSGGVVADIDVALALSNVLAAGQASYWQRGPLATQARVDVPVVGALHLIADVTALADGGVITDLTFANDYAMGSVGGSRSYTATIRRNGQVVYTSPALTHYQYQQWRWTDRPKGLNVQVDLPYLLGTGVLLNYDVSTGIESTAVRNLTYTPLGAAGVAQYMPNTGDRDDIGPITNDNAKWLLSQDAAAGRSALAQANAAASVPWHFFDRNRGEYLSLDDYPRLWGDPRGNPTLTQPVNEPTWTVDTAHQPNLSFVPYLLTGERFHLDQINAQATFGLIWTWNEPRQNGLGIVVSNAEQVRSQAWNLRQISDAAWANPDSSRSKAYWQRILDNNLNYLQNNVQPQLTNGSQQLAGFIWGDYRGDASGRRQIAPWQQDFFVSSIATAATRGSTKARSILQWMANWQVGRFGHGWAAAVSYTYNVGPGSGGWYTTWAAAETANGTSNALPTDGGYWVPLGLQTLAASYNVLGSTVARDAFARVKASAAPGTNAAAYRSQYAKLNVVPTGGAVEAPPAPPPPPPATDTSPESLWADTLSAPASTDGSAWQLGTIFTPTVNGTVTHIRAYSVDESGSHTATIWDNATGRQLVTQSWSFSGTGWRTLALTSTLAVQSGKSYTVAVTTGTDSGRRYAGIVGALTTPGSNGRDLTYPSNAGVYGASLVTRPTQVWKATNYLRDIVFQPSSP